MADFYLDGAWEGAEGGGRREIRCPADGTLVAEVDEGGAGGHRPRPSRAAHRAFDEGPWPGTLLGRARRAAAQGRRPARAGRRRGRSRRSRSTPASAWSRASTTSTTSSSCFRHFGRVAAEDAGRVVDTGNPDVVSRIVHEPVGVCGLITPWNYPLLQVVLEGRAVPGGRQHVRAQAERAHPAHRHPPDAAARGGRPAGRRRPTWCSAPAPRSGAPLSDRPARRPGVVHRRAGDRQADHGRGRRAP